MKKIILYLLCLSFFVGLIPCHLVKAIDMDIIYQEELENAIITGDGTVDNPYVIDPEKAPYFSLYLEDKKIEVLNNLNGNEITVFGVLDGVLKGDTYTNQKNGGYWKFDYENATPPSLAYNGNIWMKSINYLSLSDVEEMTDEMNETIIEYLKGEIVTISGMSFKGAVTYMCKQKFIKESTAIVLAKWIGCGTTAKGVVVTALDLAKFLKDKPYKDADSMNVGLIEASYCTSYNGAWYQQYLNEPWEDYDTVRLPKTAYGIGKYTPN